MNKTVKKIWNIIAGIIVGLAVLLAVALAGVRLVGIKPYTVLSPSMEPAYHVGSLVYVKKVDVFDLEVGDPITFMLDEDTVATHRIVEILPDENDPTVLRFFTKGDANESVDGKSVHSNNVIGKPIFTIPYLGYFADYIQNPPGMYVAISAGALLVLLAFIPDLFGGDNKDDKKDGNKNSTPLAAGATPPQENSGSPSDPVVSTPSDVDPSGGQGSDPQ